MDNLEKGQLREWDIKGNKEEKIFEITAIGESMVLYKYSHAPAKSDGTIAELSGDKKMILDKSKPYTPTKKYYLWDVKDSEGAIFKSSYYMNEDGCLIGGRVNISKDKLIKKHENEFIEV